MENNAERIESLAESATEYGKTSYELIKLKLIDKISDVVSSLIPHSIIFFFIAIFLLFCNFGIVFWLGEILGKIYFGFFAVAAFYIVLVLFMYLFMHKWFKKTIYNSIIKQLLK